MTTQAVPPTGQPDWGSITEEILCPLCGYNLQGLVEPRCPECGYGFEWLDLIDPSRRLHPYLFEHHPERNIWSFRKTLTGALLPRRFWRSLHPAQPSNWRRLVTYWFVTATIFMVCGLGSLCGRWITDIRSRIVSPAVRAKEAASLRQLQSAHNLAAIQQSFGSLDAYLDTYLPDHMSARLVWDSVRWHMPAILLCLLTPLWPPMNFAALMIFQISMRRAQVKWTHVLRSVFYSGGTLAWVGIVFANGLGMASILQTCSLGRCALAVWILAVLLILVLLASVVYQLIIAYRRYLRFDHSITTIMISQGLIALATFTTFTVVWVLLYC